ncbi:Protein of unknown function DUF241 [Macleaya cordata]|uniref:DUF241 domain-containing protein n=1 Tax=Macleaya cordata TaxID=56857 RepID=A0A200QL47_MACCD|nr:Protein of unknown function DUF241 [Macleaya cordata]
MASSILPGKTRKNCVRSISLPARFHSSTLRIEEELNKLKAWETTTTASHGNVEMIHSGLSGLKDLYDCVEDVLQLPLTQQQAHNYSDEKLVDEVLDGSVGLLDVCDTTRNILMQMKENGRDLQYGLRRRGTGAESTMESKVDAYICCRKKLRKEMLKCIGLLKRMESKFIGSSYPLLLDQNNHLVVVVVRVLREVSSITISVFRSLLSFLSAPSSSKPKTSSRWSLVSKLLHQKGQITSFNGKHHQDDDINIDNEVESVDVAIHNLSSCRKNRTSTLEVAQKRLNALEVSIEGLEDGLESMFKCLIKTRVSLLNNFSVCQSRDLIIRIR